MTTHLDLDDVCAGNPKAQEELAAISSSTIAIKTANKHTEWPCIALSYKAIYIAIGDRIIRP